MANDIITKPYLKEVLSGVKNYVDSKGAATVIVDAELSDTSENAVQNKAVKTALDAKADKTAIPSKVSQLQNDKGYVTGEETYTKKETDGKIEALSKKIVAVDPEISDTSENAVQNKAVKSYVDNMRVKFAAALPDTGEDNLIYAVKKQSLKYIPYEVWTSGNIDFDMRYSLGYALSYDLVFFTYIADDGESFSVGDYLSDSLTITLYKEQGYISKFYVLIHNTADDTYISKKVTVESDINKPIKGYNFSAYKITSIEDSSIKGVLKVIDDVVPPVTAENTQKISADGFILRKTTYVLYTYNSGKWQQLGARFASDLMDIDSLKTQLKLDIKRREKSEGLGDDLKLNLDNEFAKKYSVTASTNLTMELDGGAYSLDVYIKNAASSEITVTIPDDYVSNTHSFKMAADSYVALTVCYSRDFEKYIVNIGSALG